MVRRITLADRIAEPVPLAAVRLLDADRWAELRDRCISRIDEAIQRVGENSDEQKALEAQKQRLSVLVPNE
jgi:predicted acylesterase/phospholipase RssA